MQSSTSEQITAASSHAYYQGELSLHETADVLGISVAAAKSRIIRGRRKLRRVMESYRSAMRR
ncbi:RNA polymerase sigma factor [Edaphobacter bradus]|uniref:RNA polymerase sigma factor n=1 Tax=Edaphobacter bradus TaxID=2259016 RepID=UPI0037C17B07